MLLFKIMLTNCPLNPPNIIFSCLHDILLYSSTNLFSHPDAISHPNDCQIFIFTKKTGKGRSILQLSNVHTSESPRSDPNVCCKDVGHYCPVGFQICWNIKLHENWDSFLSHVTPICQHWGLSVRSVDNSIDGKPLLDVELGRLWKVNWSPVFSDGLSSAGSSGLIMTFLYTQCLAVLFIGLPELLREKEEASQFWYRFVPRPLTFACFLRSFIFLCC